MKKILFGLLLSLLFAGCGSDVNKVEEESENHYLHYYCTVKMPIIPEIKCYIPEEGSPYIWGEDYRDLVIRYSEITYFNEDYKKWLYEEFRPTWQYMQDQIKEVNPYGIVAYHGLNSYLFATIKEFEITANVPVFGREKGENLVDLFYLYNNAAIFTYPEGDMVAYDMEPTMHEISEFIDNEYMSPSLWRLVPKESILQEELPEQLELTVSVTLSTGGTAKCTLSPRTK